MASEAQVDAGLQEAILAASMGDEAIGGSGIALPLIGKRNARDVGHVSRLVSAVELSRVTLRALPYSCTTLLWRLRHLPRPWPRLTN